ncbi:MAG TPA: FAD-dependent oxidoreductase [Kiritimatiellia bacterium]|nr:FAD-dependent oxidoreductase [Kiritimatiellia bacterium]HMP35164.1 FAD-dependent oxidoreductase [Kiritimatiellia bacterium]
MVELDFFKDLSGPGLKRSDQGMRIAVVGGGLAGIACARMLAVHGFSVTVFEKDQEIGGRASILSSGRSAPDHGCQYLTVRDKRFQPYLDELLNRGVMARWPARIASCLHGTCHSVEDTEAMYIGVPGMNAIAECLGRDLDVRRGTIVSAIKRVQAGWKLFAGGKRESFDGVVVSTPPEQVKQLLQAFPSIAAESAKVRSRPCWALIAGFDHDLPVAFDAAHFSSSPIAWAANNRSKPGRTRDEVWTILSTPDWADSHLSLPEADVGRTLLSAFFESSGIFPSVPASLRVHRWYYGQAEEPLHREFLWDHALWLGACGDWCASGRLDGAFLSGLRLAEAIIKDCPRRVAVSR